MFSVIYKWKLKEGHEETFREGWRKITELFYQEYNSKGSRLHKSNDGFYIAYAQWPDRETWAKDKDISDQYDIYFKMMTDSVEQGFEPVLLDVIDDLLQ